MENKLTTPSEQGRAWVEIDLDALAYNAAQLRALLPQGCELMAVVKTDAYGHGAEKVAERLENEGVKSFAVATVGEGVRLRKNGLAGDILVLGYTHPNDAAFLHDFRLTQLIADGAHAKALDETRYEFRVHIAIDTGMHREGILVSEFDEIESVFKCKNLTVGGMATHLASSDSLTGDDIKFTNTQIERFYATADTLKGRGYDAGKLHIQASYGMYNYPGVKCDYVRIGIGLYGVMSHKAGTAMETELKPVLSLRAIISQVRWIGAGESVSYGRIFTADKPLKLATVCIGYADGVPRIMSGRNGECIIRGRKAPIVGRICMDLLMVDVTAIDNVAAGDVATLIGADGNEAIRCEDFAEASGTITNEILCRMGSRLPRVYLGNRA